MSRHTALYSILNLDPDASQDDIKRAYKNLVRIYHPDRNANPSSHEQFIRIRDAYHTLYNLDTRALYDLYGRIVEPPLRGNDDERESNNRPLYNETPTVPTSETRRPSTQYSYTFNTSREPRGSNVGDSPRSSTSYSYTFSQGEGSTYDPRPNSFCRSETFSHSGSSTSSTSSGQNSPASNPNANQNTNTSTSSTNTQFRVVLRLSIVDVYNGCTRIEQVERRDHRGQIAQYPFRIEIKPGTKSGTTVTFPQSGSYNSATGTWQDLVFVCAEDDGGPTAIFSRQDYDLHMNFVVSLRAAMTGIDREIVLPGGKKHKVKVDTPVQTGHKVVYPGLGFVNGPLMRAQQTTEELRGNLIVHFKVKKPSELTPAQRKAIEKHFN
ncbi:uncharacterized protein SAPINGB_P000314 [Magnusiomyces paraingens]|uniref:J domain-containing protein n=1 Tax=Magnusiomyces paraingens TaxID=2606893 RepID=A0A5E8AYA9_9ASCO|nr:uncharacterized protein SAPINGB_P000314 [Saprochaete ingens]VVT44131.1 unnamed protein product [Saprochaete ingens]